MTSPEAGKLNEILRNAPKAVDMSLTYQREAGEQLYGNLSGLLPLLVIVGGDEALLDDPIRLVRAAGIAEVDTTLYVGAKMQHVFPVYAGFMPEADQAIAMIGAWVCSRIS